MFHPSQIIENKKTGEIGSYVKTFYFQGEKERIEIMFISGVTREDFASNWKPAGLPKSCNECFYISITEYQQIDKTINHMCKLHNVRLIHRSSNPKEHDFIHPCNECCGGHDFKNREDVK